LHRILRALVCVIAGLISLPSSRAATAEDIYLRELAARARQLRLAERPEWLKLLHYKPNLLLPGVHSLVDSREFFNAPNGKTDPEAELEATLAAFFSDVEETQDRQNPQCRFIARYTWLRSELAFDPARLPPRRCKRFDDWHAALNPGGLTLVFPTAFLNSPSSMYGHTLLRVDAKDQDERTRLLAYAINFAAITDETNGILFAVNGLIGTYPGEFSIMPYYLKVREYNDLENRDIWEYELNLTPEEIDRVLMHAWELGPAYFDYYFFDENCAYHLLGLLETARPDLDLTDRFRWWAVPSETVRAVVQVKGLVSHVTYRPSNATVIRFRLGPMDGAQRREVRDLGLGRIGLQDPRLLSEPVAQQAAELEVANDYVGYLRAAGRVPEAEGAARARELMLARSRLDVPASDAQPPEPEVRPDQGHGAARVAPAFGWHDGREFEELGLRPVYHDLMDPEPGYVHGAQLEFFDFALRHYEGGATEVQKFVPVDILSLAPRNDFFQPLSWKINAGWTRERQPDGTEPMVFGVNGGAGFTRSAPDAIVGEALLYAFLEGTTRVDRRIGEGYGLGAGPSVGALVDVTPQYRVNATARVDRFFLGQQDTEWRLQLQQRLTLGRQAALRLDLARQREAAQLWNDGMLSLMLYF